jgi:hypothetical protein
MRSNLRTSEPNNYSVKFETAGFSETYVPFNQTVRTHITEYTVLSYSAVRIVFFIFLQVALFFSVPSEKKKREMVTSSTYYNFTTSQLYNLKIHIKTQNALLFCSYTSL